MDRSLTWEIEHSSSGHKLGQLVGDWFQDYFVSPLLEESALRLGLFLDHRNRVRSVRGDKVLWFDEEGNAVDYDFVMELQGGPDLQGIPVAFLECFWRRGSRHSKDKARDDSSKLAPMRRAYPTARFLGIVASGEFTRPARELIESRNIHLLYVPKSKIIETFNILGVEMDYDDKASEEMKRKIASRFEQALTPELKMRAATTLRTLIGETGVRSYLSSVQAALSSVPLEFRIISQRLSKPATFESIEAVSNFLSSNPPPFDFSSPETRYLYQATYSDGTEFERELKSIKELERLHTQIADLAAHMSRIAL